MNVLDYLLFMEWLYSFNPCLATFILSLQEKSTEDFVRRRDDALKRIKEHGIEFISQK